MIPINNGITIPQYGSILAYNPTVDMAHVENLGGSNNQTIRIFTYITSRKWYSADMVALTNG
jgi:hypothetical protein